MACRNNLALRACLGIVEGSGQTALDPGSGPGCQNIPLAETGWRAIAVDVCANLLAEPGHRRVFVISAARPT